MPDRLPRMADDFRRLLYEIDGEVDKLTRQGVDQVYRNIGYNIQETVLRLQRLADELGRREWDRGSG
jgi:hypothetical protein